jgi:hypothetical protein
MRLLSSEEYQGRINPWLNRNLQVAHAIPFSFPTFRSLIVNEFFLFLLAITLFALMNIVISFMFSLPGMGSKSVGESFSSTFASPKKFIVFSLIVMIYMRVAMAMIGRLTTEVSVRIFGFSMMMCIVLFSEYTPDLYAWLDGKVTNYYSHSSSTMFMVWLLVSIAFSSKLVRQFREAKNKKVVLALTS